MKWIYNPERVREFSRKYGEEHKEDEKAYNQQYTRREVECESCGLLEFSMEVVKEIWVVRVRKKEPFYDALA